jgi:VIT1/CCC1 family predicted Fe2+/Mn2+ transporter
MLPSSTTPLEALAETLVSQGLPTPDVRAVAARLARNELFDGLLYRRLAQVEKEPDVRQMLLNLSEFEDRHIRFWQRLAGLEHVRLTLGLQVKMAFLLFLRRLLGSKLTFLILEAIEHYGITKYLKLWERYRHTPLAEGIRAILMDELKHEDEVITQASQRRIRSEDFRNTVLGLNDGLVEILGSVGGFYAAFRDPHTVALAASIVGVAGALSMAAGAYASVKSEVEVQTVEKSKMRVLAEITGNSVEEPPVENPWRAALVVGVFYLLGALIPVLPFWLGAQQPIVSFACGFLAAGLMAALLAVMSGTPVLRKMTENALIVAGTVAITYAIGLLAQRYFGIEVH